MPVEVKDAEHLSSTTGVGLHVVDFWAPWCGPCKSMLRQLDGFQARYPDLSILKVNVDDHRELARKFSVTSIPTLLVVKDGAVMETMTGVTSIPTLSALVDKYL